MKNYTGFFFFVIIDLLFYENPQQFVIDLVGNYSLMEAFCYQMEFFLRSDFKTAEVVERKEFSSD